MSKNDGQTVLLENVPGSAEGCTVEGEPFEIYRINYEEIYSVNPGEGTVSQFELVMEFFEGQLVCEWDGQLDLSYVPGTNLLHLSSENLRAKPEVCGPASLEATLKLVGGWWKLPIYLF